MPITAHRRCMISCSSSDFPLLPDVNDVGYVGHACGQGGLSERCSSHQAESYRVHELVKNRKFLYKYTEGEKDGFKRQVTTYPIAFLEELPNCRHTPPLGVLYKLVEAIFVIRLRTMSLTRKVHEIDGYTTLAPADLKCANDFIPTNRIVPTQTHFASIKQKPKCRGSFKGDIRGSGGGADQN
jgi:hypothetical protein